jgi:hypothetical protein
MDAQVVLAEGIEFTPDQSFGEEQAYPNPFLITTMVRTYAW